MNSFCSAKNSNRYNTRDINRGKTMGPLLGSLTHPAFPNRSGTAHNVHVNNPTNDKYCNSKITEFLRVQCTSKDPPYNAKDV